METGAQEQAHFGTRTTDQGMTLLLASASGIIAAGSYLAQPLAATIARELNITPGLAGLMVTLSQIGYCLGLLFVLPLADRVENRRLLTTMLVGSVASMVLAACASDGISLFIACLGIGATSVAVQIIVGEASRLSSPMSRGRVVGGVTGGLLFGILLAWPFANVVDQTLGWRTLFIIEGGAIAVLAICLRYVLSSNQPQVSQSYTQTLSSLSRYWAGHTELRHRAYVQALMFFVFSMTWTYLPLLLQQRHGFQSAGIAWFGLAGAAGVLTAPIAGRLADRRHTSMVSKGAAVAVIAGGVTMCLDPPWWLLMVAIIFIDGGVQASHVVSQRRILLLESAAANRLNSLYVAVFFLGGAVGSLVGIPLYQYFAAAPGIGAAIAGLLALAVVRSSKHL